MKKQNKENQMPIPERKENESEEEFLKRLHIHYQKQQEYVPAFNFNAKEKEKVVKERELKHLILLILFLHFITPSRHTNCISLFPVCKFFLHYIIAHTPTRKILFSFIFTRPWQWHYFLLQSIPPKFFLNASLLVHTLL
ncbi:hypothetical protein ES703_31687 [subsurface metagenome]